MKRLDLTTASGLVCAGVALALGGMTAVAQKSLVQEPDGYLANNRPPDPTYKADILLVVAHPDDEVLSSAFLAREIHDHHKRVAVVYGTHGSGSNNQVGAEQSRAMGDVREMEARRAEASLGITNVWFLAGHDTASQNVLNSLDHWGHGACLDELVRIVRLTRPAVILTFLPDFTTGENHADHQAAGVLATEAFDVAGDPTFLSEQVSPAGDLDKNMNMTEGLRPWQPEKIYYFYNPTQDIFEGKGPHYKSSEISPSKHESYAMLAAKSLENHRTQGGVKLRTVIKNNALDESKDPYAELASADDKFILGKSLVPSGVRDDVFAGVAAEGVPFHRATGYRRDDASKPELKIGDPWNFYHEFWKAHDIAHLMDVVPLELTVKVGGDAVIPLSVDNPLDRAITVKFNVDGPQGWNVTPPAALEVPAHSRCYTRVRAAAPDTKLPGWQKFEVRAEVDGESIGSLTLRAELSNGWVAPQ